AADPRAGQLGHVGLAVPLREAEQIDLPFGAALEVTAEAEQALAVRAEGVEADADGPPIGPAHLVALEANLLTLAVTGRVTAKQDGQGTWHPWHFSKVRFISVTIPGRGASWSVVGVSRVPTKPTLPRRGSCGGLLALGEAYSYILHARGRLATRE